MTEHSAGALLQPSEEMWIACRCHRVDAMHSATENSEQRIRLKRFELRRIDPSN